MSASYDSNGIAGHTDPNRELVIPDVHKCRAKRSGSTQYEICLVPAAASCKLALSFGPTIFCLHPLRQDIVAQTKAQ